jgi:hypothetical protein
MARPPGPFISGAVPRDLLLRDAAESSRHLFSDEPDDTVKKQDVPMHEL